MLGNMKLNGQEHEDGTYDHEIAKKYPTLFDYWESEVYVLPPVITGLDADYIIINLAAEKLAEGKHKRICMYLDKKVVMKPRLFGFLKIVDLNLFDYYGPELTSYTDKFWDETLIRKIDTIYKCTICRP